MNDTLIDHADSGEIARIQTPMTDLATGEIHHIDDLGTEPTRNLAAERQRLLEEHTQNIGPYAEFSRPIRRPDLTGELPALIDVPLGLSGDNLAGPQSPPPPLPKPPPSKYDMAAAQPVAPWERVADTEQVTILGSLGADLPEVLFPPLRKSVPYVLPADRKPWSGPRHAAPPPLWARLSIAVGLSLLLGSTLGLVVLAVIQ